MVFSKTCYIVKYTKLKLLLKEKIINLKTNDKQKKIFATDDNALTSVIYTELSPIDI